MLRTNLSTRPFYNERLVTVVLAAVGVAVAVASAFNARALVSLTQRQSALGQTLAASEAHIKEVQQQTAAVRASIDDKERLVVGGRAAEVNAVIDLRVFSWTDFFNRIEATIPPDVMLVAVRPSTGKDAGLVSMTVLGKTVSGIDTFMERLESTATFEGLLSREEQATEDGMYRAVLEGRYVAKAVEPSTAPTATVASAPTEGASPPTPPVREGGER
ncbi:MAG: hypothetical protein U0Q12_00140 [Vicinamibacterales bacterium]